MKSYVFSNEFYKNIDLMVYTCGLEQCKPNHSYGWGVRSSWMIHFVLEGKGTYRCDDQEFHLEKGDLFLMIPGQRIYYEADPVEPWTYGWVGLQGLKVEEYMNRSFLPSTLIAHLEESSSLYQIIQQLGTIQYQENEDLHLNSLAYSIMYEIVRAFPAGKEKNQNEGKEYAQLILSYVEKHFDQPITISGIASYFSLDRTYIHRLIKKEIGISLQEYIISLRLANACSYLAFSDLSISDIARSVGYEDSLAFSKIFRKHKGISPKAYREKKRSL